MQVRENRPHVESFYHLSTEILGGKVCQGMACFVARHLDQERWKRATSQPPRIYCLGKCYRAPASGADEERPRIEVHAPKAIILSRILEGGTRTLAAYTQKGGYTALEKALTQPPDDLIRAVELSGLRGRGGAGFPTGRKWRAVFEQKARTKFVVANADEGDPGAYIDRFILEDDPHCLIEAMVVAGYAVGANQGYIYLRNEYPKAQTILGQAIDEARRGDILGNRVFGSAYSFHIELVIGRGSYVSGEETALLNSIEGRRPEVRARPPYPATHGLFGRPTLVNNVETLANVPWIVRHGGEAYHALGFSNSRGTKVVSLNSLFRRPGLYEVEFGVPVRRIVEDLGGGLKAGSLKGVIIGGPLAGIIPPKLLDTPLGFEELHAVGAAVGHGGVIAFDDRTSVDELIRHVFAFGAYESCGKCTPCRLGSSRIERMFGELRAEGSQPKARKAELIEILDALLKTSLCGLGTGLGEFGASVLRYYREELETCFA